MAENVNAENTLLAETEYNCKLVGGESMIEKVDVYLVTVDT